MIIELLPENMRVIWGRLWFTEKRRRKFYRKVAELYSNTIMIDQILSSLIARAKKKNPKSTEAWVYTQIAKGLSGSGKLSSGTKLFVPAIDQILITAGEESGDLAKTLLSAAELNEKAGKVKGLIRKALAYPLFLTALTLAFACFLATAIFPSMTDFVPVEKWPSSTRTVYAIAQFTLSWYPLILLLFAGIVIIIWFSFAHLTGPFRIRLDKIPPWSLYRLSQGGAWILSISSMVGAGMINKNALKIVENLAGKNPWLSERTRAVEDNLARAQSMGKALGTKYHFPDQELCDDMADYDTSPNFNDIFEKVGKEWIDVSIAKIGEQSKILNGIALISVILCIGYIVNAFLSLTLSVANTMSSSTF